MKALNVKARSLYVILRKQQLSVFKTVMNPASWENYLYQSENLFGRKRHRGECSAKIYNIPL